MPFHFLLAVLLLLPTLPCLARNAAVNFIPNGNIVSCASCHTNPAGAGARTPFGVAVNFITGGNSEDPGLWSSALAAADSDGDGISNGDELRDPDGDGIPLDDEGVTNPGNRPPTFTSSAVTTATVGTAYLYVATAADFETNARSYTKVSGPSWLSVSNVSNTGRFAGTPPNGSSGTFSVTVRVEDTGTASKGFSLSGNNQTYTLKINTSFADWQSVNFTLPAEAALAASTADPDGDGLDNYMEYALRLPPKVITSFSFLQPTRTAGGKLKLGLTVRDDDAKLSVTLETASDVTFASLTTIAAAITDPVPGDGVKTWEFTDTGSNARRFGRVKVAILP